MIDALISDGPFKGYSLGGAMAITNGAATPTQVKEAMIAACEAKITELHTAIHSIRSLPDEIRLS